MDFKLNLETLISLTALALSLFVLGRDYWRARIWLEVRFSSGNTNEMYVYNKSSKSISIVGFELKFYNKVENKWNLARSENFPDNEGFLKIRMSPRSSPYFLLFDGEDYFLVG